MKSLPAVEGLAEPEDHHRGTSGTESQGDPAASPSESADERSGHDRLAARLLAP
jgi:hypothetical protein